MNTKRGTSSDAREQAQRTTERDTQTTNKQTHNNSEADALTRNPVCGETSSLRRTIQTTRY